MNLNRDIYKLSNYQSGLLYEVKSGYFKSIHDYLSKNDKDIEFEKLLLFNSISSLNINACKILLNNNRYDKKIFDKEFYYNLFLKEDLDFLKTFFKIDFIKENINEVGITKEIIHESGKCNTILGYIDKIDEDRVFEFKFTNEKDEPIEGVETVTEMSFKKAVKSVQNKIKDKWVIIEYLTKKGKDMIRFLILPIAIQRRVAR